MLKVTAGLQVT